MKRYLTLVPAVIQMLALAGCVTTGYSYARNPSIVHKWNATVTSVSKVNIYNSMGAEWVGPLAKVEAVGLKVSLITDDGQHVTEV